MGYVIDLDPERCVACGACAIACMDQNDTDVEYGSFRNIYQVEEEHKGDVEYTFLSIGCMHCEDAPCIKGCPTGCLKKDEETGFTIYDNTNCIGCHSCAMACPFGAPQFNEQHKMVKCDGCVDRVKEGLEPACVRVCPFFALNLYTEEEYQEVKRKRAAKKMAMQG